MLGNRWRWVLAILAVLVTIVLAVATVLAARRMSLENLNTWAGLLSAAIAGLFGALRLDVFVVRWALGLVDKERLDRAAGRLSRAVHRQWLDEIHARALDLPKPLRLRWRPSDRPVSVEYRDGGRGRFGSLVQDLGDNREPAIELITALERGGPQQVVVIGEPGAGKSTLAALFTAGAARMWSGTEIPVLLSIAGWDPAEPIDAWVTRRIAEDYSSAVRRREAKKLMDAGRILPVLDGLDEISGKPLLEAMWELRRAAADGLRMMITCRSEEYQYAVSKAGTLMHAVVVEIEKIGVDDAITFLTQPEAEGTTRWRKVVKALRKSPDGPVAQALSTPMMISLARKTYDVTGPRDRTGGDGGDAPHPDELTKWHTVTEVQQQVLRGFLPSVYGSESASNRATRWLTFLVQQLGAHGPNLRWWQLAQAVPRSIMTGWITAAITVLGALTGVLIHAVAGGGSGPTQAAVAGALTGAALGVIAGRHAARSGAAQPWRNRRGTAVAFIRAVVSDVTAAAATFSVAGVVVVVAARWSGKAWLVSSFGVVEAIQRLPHGDARFLVMAVLFLLACLVVATITNGLGVGRTGTPQRPAFGLRSLLPSLAFGVTMGLLVFAVVWLAWSLVGLRDDVDPDAGLVIVLALSAVAAVCLTVGRWLSTPAPDDTAIAPLSTLDGDRVALLMMLTFTSLASAAATAVILWVTGTRPVLAAEVGVGIGLDVAVVVLFGAGTSWLSYTVARLWLALLGLLPWRLASSLGDAREKGILRHAGAAYQVRHDLLRDYLARQAEPTRRWAVTPRTTRLASATVDGGGLRRHGRGVALACAVLLFPVVALVISPPPPANPPPAELAQPYRVVFSADGRMAAPSRRRDFVEIYDARTRAVLARTAFVANVDEITFSADGRRLVTTDHHTAAQRGDVVNIWDADDGDCLAVLVGTDGLYDPVYSPDRSILATTGVDGVIRLWDTGTGNLLVVLDGSASPVDRAVFSGDGRLLATASGDGTVLVWDVRKDRAVASLAGHRGGILSLAFDRAGGSLVTTGSDHTARIWDVASGRQRAALTGLFFDAAFSPAGDRVATAGHNGIATIWDASSGATLLSLRGHSDPIFAVDFSSDGEALATGGADGTARAWDARTGALTGIYVNAVVDALDGRGPLDHHAVYDVAFSRSGDRLATEEDHSRIKVWNRTGDLLQILDGPSDRVAFDTTGRTLSSTGDDGRTRVWNVEGGDLETVLDRPLRGLVLNRRRDRMLVAGPGGGLSLWRSGPVARLGAFDGPFKRARFTPEGRTVLTTGPTDVIESWDAESGRRRAVLGAKDTGDGEVVVSADGGSVATAAAGAITVWATANGRSVRVGAGDVTQVRLSADGRRLATVDHDGVVAIWDAVTGRPVTTLTTASSVTGVTFRSYTVEFTAGGEQVVTANSDGTLRVWDSRSGKLIDQESGVGGTVDTLVVSPDGRSVAASLGPDGAARLWLR